MKINNRIILDKIAMVCAFIAIAGMAIVFSWAYIVVCMDITYEQDHRPPPAATVKTCNGDITLHYAERMMVIGDKGCVRVESAPEQMLYSPALLNR